MKHLLNHHMLFPYNGMSQFHEIFLCKIFFYLRHFRHLSILHTKCVINLILQTVVILWFNCRNNASISLKTTCRTKVFTTFLIMYHLITVWKICQITTWIALSTISIKLHVTISRDFFMQDFFLPESFSSSESWSSSEEIEESCWWSISLKRVTRS